MDKEFPMQPQPESTSEADEQESACGMNVLLVEHDPLILATLRELLQSEFTIVGVVRDGESALREAAHLRPDIVVLGISTEEPTDMTMVRRLQETSSQLRVVLLGRHEFVDFIRHAVDAGVAAYVFRSQWKADLKPALRAAAAGRLFVSRRSA
jgi:DNA-binding NarL/FixJ family response regulator